MMTRFISIPALLLAIPILHGLAFTIYAASHPDQDVATQLWTYMESGTFKLISGSILIPLFFSILEKRYSFLEGLRKQREEKQRQLREEKRTARRNVINETLEMWRRLNELAGKIIFSTPHSEKDTPLYGIVAQLMEFTSYAEQIVNKWSHQFPVLTRRDQDLFLEFINILYQSSLSIAFFVQNEKDTNKRVYFQNILYLIQDQVKSIAHHRILDSLKYALVVMELHEDNASKTEINSAQANLNGVLEQLTNWKNHVRRLEKNHDNFLSPSNSAQVQEIRATVKKIEPWLREDEKRMPFDHKEEWPVFQKQFNDLPLAVKLDALKAPYSQQYLEALAREFSLDSACDYIYNRTHGRW